MTAAIENVAELRICASTEPVRKHRERRRNGLRLMSVAMPEANIEQAITRRVLKPEAHRTRLDLEWRSWQREATEASRELLRD